jgi:hypothetical protein
MDAAVTEPLEAARRLGRDAIRIIQQNNPTGSPRHQASDVRLEPAVGQVHREQWMTRSVLAFLAHIEKGNLGIIGEPSPGRLDVDESGHPDPL